MHNIKEEIENNSISLFQKRVISQHVYNDGKNKDNLKAEKALMLSELVKEHTNLVHTKKHYPVNDLMDINLEVDLIVIDRNTFERIFNNG